MHEIVRQFPSHTLFFVSSRPYSVLLSHIAQCVNMSLWMKFSRNCAVSSEFTTFIRCKQNWWYNSCRKGDTCSKCLCDTAPPLSIWQTVDPMVSSVAVAKRELVYSSIGGHRGLPCGIACKRNRLLHTTNSFETYISPAATCSLLLMIIQQETVSDSSSSFHSCCRRNFFSSRSSISKRTRHFDWYNACRQCGM